MKAVHWLRSRQEEREISYWLALVSYERSDHSFNNRIYLLYLIVFFTVWIFVTLTFFASGGAIFLEMVNLASPEKAVILIELIVLGGWSLYSIYQGLRRSPVSFSEEDGILVSQTPIPRSQIVLRWLFMPWLKNAVVFWIVAVILGFSLAEVILPGAMSSGRIIEYLGFGIRAWLAILPIHLLLFVFHWVVGVARLSVNLRRNEVIWIVLPILLFLYGSLIVLHAGICSPTIPLINSTIDILIAPFMNGFTPVFNWLLWLSVWILVIFSLMCLHQLSVRFSLNRAVQETSKNELIKTAMQYGFTEVAESEKTQRRLGVERKPSQIPAKPGARMLLWKDLVQSSRTFGVGKLFGWLQIFLLFLVIPILPDYGSRGIVLIYWIFQLGQIAVKRIRNDLALWPLIRQLPIKASHLLVYDLAGSYLLAVAVSMSGYLIGTVFSDVAIAGFVLLIPGLIAAVYFMAVFDVIRRSKSALLLNGTVPELSAGGILLGIVFAGIPLVLFTIISNLWGMGLSLFISIGAAFLAFTMAEYAYRNIDHA